MELHKLIDVGRDHAASDKKNFFCFMFFVDFEIKNREEMHLICVGDAIYAAECWCHVLVLLDWDSCGNVSRERAIDSVPREHKSRELCNASHSDSFPGSIEPT